MMLHKDEENADYDDVETTPSEMKGLAFTFIFLMTIMLAIATGLLLLVF